MLRRYYVEMLSELFNKEDARLHKLAVYLLLSLSLCNFSQSKNTKDNGRDQSMSSIPKIVILGAGYGGDSNCASPSKGTEL